MLTSRLVGRMKALNVLTYEDYLKRREEEEAQQKAQDGNE